MPVSPFNIGTTVDLEALRTRLQKMTDGQLAKFGGNAEYFSSPKANMGQPPREVLIQLEEARAEWNRRKEKRRAKAQQATSGNDSVHA